MPGASLIDVREGTWFEVDSRTASSLLRQGERLRYALRLGANPVTVRRNSARIDGIAGAILARETTIQIVPKFLQYDRGSWLEGLNAYLNYAGRGVAHLAASRTQTAPLQSFIDNTAFQFCEILEVASRVGLPLTYTSRRAVGQMPRGRLDITHSLRNLASLRPALEWHEMTLNHDTAAARVIRLALQLLARQSRDTRVQRRVERNLSTWPVVPAAISPRVPVLPRSFAYFRPVVDFAYEICLGLGRAPGTENEGYSYVVDMVRTFERTMERALVAAARLVDDRPLAVVRQDSIRYARALTSGVSDYYSRPDAVVYDGCLSRIVVDAKYKSFDDREAATRPANADFYQLLTAAIAHRTALALLVYPASPGLVGGTIFGAWRIPVYSAGVVTLAAGAVNVVGLSPGTTSSQMHLEMKGLLGELTDIGGAHS